MDCSYLIFMGFLCELSLFVRTFEIHHRVKNLITEVLYIQSEIRTPVLAIN